MRLILILVFSVISCAVQAQDLAASASKRIAGTPYFAFGGVGYAGPTSKGEIDFQVLLAQPTEVALLSFEKLYATGNTEAKAYALAGIRELNPEEFNQLVESAQNSKQQVTTMEGCFLMHRMLTEIAADLKSGKYDYWIRRGRLRR
jgi:hypothetical protein